jgi:integrase
MKLTQTIIDKATYQGTARTMPDGKVVWSRYVLWDDEQRGLGVRIFPGGGKSFVLFYRAGSRQRLMRLGEFGVLTLKTARVKARKNLASVDEGRDPLAERKAAAKAATVNALADRYLTDHAEVKKKPASAKTDRQMLRDYVRPKLGHLAANAVNRPDVAALHNSLRDKPYVANRVLALVSKMLNLAETWGMRPDGSNPCRHVEKFRERPRERYLTPAEFTLVAETLNSAEAKGKQSLHALAAIRLLIFTGCRLREILHLRWEHVDLENSRLRLPDSKTGAKTVFLAAPARELLLQLPRTEGNPWVIEGRSPDSHLSDLKGPWRRICEAAKIEELRIHDLRHSYAAVGAGLGLSLPMLGKLLGHTQPRTTARYAHLAADPMHEAADRIGVQLTAVMTPKAVDSVPPN